MVPRGHGLAVGAEGHAINTALGHREGLFLEPLASRRVPEHHTPDDAEGNMPAAAVPRGQGLAVGAEGQAHYTALGHGEGLFLEPLASRRVPEHHTPDVDDAVDAVPRGQGLAVGAEGYP